jgi:CTP:molybdopterin cytidylyltransferase MocA
VNDIVVLLAAGESSRTTGMKQLYMVNDDYLINHQIDKLLSFCGFFIILVFAISFPTIGALYQMQITSTS